MVGLDFLLGLETPKLHVPTQFEPTRGYADRGWFIPPFGKNPTWSIGLAAVFALMGTILIFMDQQITAVIVNRQGFKNDIFLENCEIFWSKIKNETLFEIV